MAIATPTFTGFRPEAIDFLAELAEQQRPRLVPAAQGRVRAAAQGADGGARRRARRAVRGARHPAPRRPEAVDLPDLPRHPVLQGQVAVQDPSRGELPVDRSRTATGTRSPTRAPRQRRLLQLPARRDVRRAAGMWMADEGAARRVPAGHRRGPGPRPGRARGAGVPSRRSGRSTATSTLKRVPPGLPADHPMADLFRYKDVVFGRRLSR